MLDYIHIKIAILLDLKNPTTEEYIREKKEENIEEELKDGLVYLLTLRKSEPLSKDESKEEYEYKKLTNRVKRIGEMISIKELKLEETQKGGICIEIKIKIYKKRENKVILEEKEVKDLAENFGETASFYMREIMSKEYFWINIKKTKKEIAKTLRKSLSKGNPYIGFTRDYSKERLEELKGAAGYKQRNQNSPLIIKGLVVMYEKELEEKEEKPLLEKTNNEKI